MLYQVRVRSPLISRSAAVVTFMRPYGSTSAVFVRTPSTAATVSGASSETGCGGRKASYALG